MPPPAMTWSSAAMQDSATQNVETAARITFHIFIFSSFERRFDGGDVDLLHLHHRVERALGDGGVGAGDRLDQDGRCDLPIDAPFVLAPPARTLRAAVTDDGVP